MAVFLRFDGRCAEAEKRVCVCLRCSGELGLRSEKAVVGRLPSSEVVRHGLLRNSQPPEPIQNWFKKCRAVKRLVLPAKCRETSPPDFANLPKRLRHVVLGRELRSVAKMASQV